MYREGVTCSDCHDPHSGKLLPVSMNQVCGKCHLLSKFGNERHHHHKADSAGALCVNCHMATRTYMVVDKRRDHSFRVPRPDFSVAYGTPNACNQCHKDKSAKWAAEAVAKWYGPNRRREPGFVEAIDAGRRGLPSAEKALAALIADSTKPGIARATALSLLPQYLTPASIPALRAALADSDALVRGAAVQTLEPLAPQGRVRLAAPLLTDSIRSVRIDAARLLAGTPPDLLQEAQKTALDRAVSERQTPFGGEGGRAQQERVSGRAGTRRTTRTTPHPCEVRGRALFYARMNGEPASAEKITKLVEVKKYRYPTARGPAYD